MPLFLRRGCIAGIGLTAFAWLLAAGGALAQAPSQVQPPVIQPSPTSPTRILLPQVPAGGEIPAQAHKLSFVLIDVDVEGEFPELAEQRRALVAPLAGKR